jgi:plastocyanin
MRRTFLLASTMIVGSISLAIAACSSDNTVHAADSGGPGSGSSSGGGSTNDAAGMDATGSGTDSGTACASTQGTIVPAKWDFAVSGSALNGGKGQVLSIHVCDTVVWTNDDNGTMHSVVSTGGGFDFSTPVVTGTTAGVPLGQGVQFSQAGTFTYDCGIHGNLMIGQVTVQ